MEALSEAEKRAEKVVELKSQLDNKDTQIAQLQTQLGSAQSNAHVS